jgi:hypothetical protein
MSNTSIKPAEQASSRRRGERGVALLMTLGVVALILVLAMSFSFTSRTDRMAAANNSDTTKARLFADSGLERVLALMKYHYTGSHPQDLYPATKTAVSHLVFTDVNGRLISFNNDANDDTAGNDKLVTIFSNSSTTSIEFITEDDINSAAPEWIHVNDSSGSLIGRYSYIIIDDSGKIDPSYAVDSTYDENTGSTIKKGGTTAEICLADLGISSFNSYREDPNGQMPTGKKWFSWAHIIKGIGADQAHLNTATDVLSPLSYCKNVFLTNSESFTDSNADGRWNWRADDNTDTIWDTSETETYTDANGNGRFDYGAESPRFNLSRTDWVSLPVTIDIVKAGIPWIAGMNGGAVADQVAANLIDYCDDDDGDGNPSTDTPVAQSDYNGTTASYCGLEKVPYINEVNLKVSFTQEIKFLHNKNTFTINAQIELANMYSSSLTIPAIELTANLDMAGLSFSNKSISITWNNVVASPNGYTLTGFVSDITTVNDWFSAAGNMENFKIKDLKVVTGGGIPLTATNLHDVAVIGDSSIWPDLVPNDPSIGAGVEANDPRLNTTTSNWQWLSIGTADGSTVGTPGVKNGFCSASATPSSSYDAETVADPVNLSTAYIHNGPMQSLWELGAIHRGEAWRSINLHSYDASPDGTYVNSDWMLLDQCKLSSKTEVRGKVNLNTPNAAVWDAILTGVKLGDSYGSFSGGSSLNSIPDLRNAILGLNGGTAGTPLVSRGRLLQLANFTDGTQGTQDTDRAQEEIIGKLANLLTTRQNYFTVIVVGQAVKDLGANITSALPAKKPDNWVKYDSTGDKWCSILGEQKMMAVVYRDAFTDLYKVVRFEYLDD